MAVKIRISVFLLFILTGLNTLGQHNVNLHFMRNVPQAGYTNPAFMPENKVSVGIPGIASVYGDFGLRGIKWKDFMTVESDGLTFNQDLLVNKLDKTNYLSGSMNADLFLLGLKGKSFYMNFNVTEKVSSVFTFPDQLIAFLLQGNGPYVDQTLEINNVGLDVSHYREYGAAIAYNYQNKLKLGARIKYLQGMANVSTRKSEFSLYTAPLTYDLTTSSEFIVNTSMPDLENIDGKAYMTNFNNTGVGVDAGFEYKANDKIGIAASILDLGYIYWTDNITNYHIKGAYSFDGVDISDFVLQEEENASAFNDITEELDSIFKIEKEYDFYQTQLVSKFYLSGTYDINQWDKFGVLVFTNYFNNTINPSLTFFYSQENDGMFNSTLSYSIINGNFANFGLASSITIGPVQTHFAFDNLLGLFMPQGTNKVNARLGFNLVFGKEKKPVAEPEEEDEDNDADADADPDKDEKPKNKKGKKKKDKEE